MSGFIFKTTKFKLRWVHVFPCDLWQLCLNYFNHLFAVQLYFFSMFVTHFVWEENLLASLWLCQPYGVLHKIDQTPHGAVLTTGFHFHFSPKIKNKIENSKCSQSKAQFQQSKPWPCVWYTVVRLCLALGTHIHSLSSIREVNPEFNFSI